ncbi:MAG: hypothetical protein KatS3mg076_3189 [Candidatus Binatia bacterium]|nr:MAG: hypothetical protein KatS3mg076_3189 [Candidatus Binatia bacterium]
MPVPVAMPKLGMTMTEGAVVEWRVRPGEYVEKGSVLLVVESDKAEFEIEAPCSGYLRHVYAPADPDRALPCGTLLGVLTESADESFDAESFRERYRPGPEPPAGREKAEAGSGGTTGQGRRRILATPAARALAKKLGVELEGIPGSGPGGRVTKEDVEARAPRVSAPAGENRREERVCLEVFSEGQGEPVLCLPGFGTDASVFSALLEALGGGYEVRAVNPRGVGRSESPPQDVYAVEDLARDVAGLLREATHLVGTSLGAAVSLALAALRPDLVRSLFLVAPLFEPDPRLRAVLRLWCDLAGGDPAVLAAALVPWLFGPAFLEDPGRRQRAERSLPRLLARTPPAVLRRYEAGILAWRADLDWKALGIPATVVCGSEDLLVPEGPRLASLLPRARCVVLPGAGHGLLFEEPRRLAEELRIHLAWAAGT